jgi:phosphoserine phosphatase
MQSIKNFKLVAIDMDSTLIQQECIDELAKIANKENEISKLTEEAMCGEIDFSTSLKERVKLLKGISCSSLEIIKNRLTLTDGAIGLVDFFKSHGLKIVIISGGFDYFANSFKTLLKLDGAYANTLEIKNGYLTGRVVGDIIDSNQKANIVREICEDNNILLSEVISIGDGANDIPMLAQSGFSVAFNAKEITKQYASVAIDGSLADIIDLFRQ